MAAWPTLAEVRRELRMQPNDDDDLLIGSALAAAIEYGVGRTNNLYPPTETMLVPEAAHEAAMIHAAVIYRRRDSLDGTVGWGDTGIVRVAAKDPTVEFLYSLLGPVVFG
jgi:hypothetical protein